MLCVISLVPRPPFAALDVLHHQHAKWGLGTTLVHYFVFGGGVVNFCLTTPTSIISKLFCDNTLDSTAARGRIVTLVIEA